VKQRKAIRRCVVAGGGGNFRIAYRQPTSGTGGHFNVPDICSTP
jgi:hypothetical protein